MTREQLERKAALWDAIRRLWETGGVRLNPGSDGAEAIVYFHAKPLEPKSFSGTTPERATRTVCIDEAFGDDTQAVRHAVARWDAALCGVVHVTSRVVDPITEPCALTVLRVDPSWQWVQSRPRDALAWTDTDRGIAWVLTPARDIESIAAHEIGHLLGADHATLTRYPQQCVSHGSAVQAAYTTGKGDRQ